MTLENIFRRYKNNIYLFAVECCQVDKGNINQKLFFETVQNHRFISVRSGHKTAKTCSLAIMVLYFLVFYPGVKVIVLSGSHFSGMDSTIFPEVNKWYAKLPIMFKKFIDIKKLKQTFFNGFLVAKSPRPNDRESMQGIHAADSFLIFIVDEASGLNDEHFSAIQGSLQGDNFKCILTGNPLSNSGFFHDSFKTDKRFTRLHFNSLDSPIVSKEWADNILDRYGKDSMEYRVKVLGKFPLQESDALISYDKIVQAMSRQGIPRHGPVVASLDPARMGRDFCVLSIRQGRVIFYIKELKGRVKSNKLLLWVAREFKKLPIFDFPDKLIIDTAGLGGPIKDFIKDTFEQDDILRTIKIISINPGSVSSKPKKFKLLKDELYCSFRNYISDEEPQIINHPVLLQESAEIKYKYSIQGAIMVLKKEMDKSPDYLDSVSYGFYNKDFNNYRVYSV